MTVDEVLSMETTGLGPLHSPVLLVALSGWFDVGDTATAALQRFVDPDTAVTVAELDPDPFYDFTQERPHVEIVDGEVRVLRWPDNRFEVCRGDSSRDLVVLLGIEPHLAWPTYAEAIVRVAERLGCEAVVTVGAQAEAVPHTRTPLVTGSTTNTELAGRLGLSKPSYQGMTGVVGVLQAALEARDVPAVSLRVGIPHYLANAEHPQAVEALHLHLAHVLGVRADPGPADEIARWRSLHDEAVEHDVQLAMYVKMLEQDHDRRAEASVPSADVLAAEIERFLRDQRPDD
ncbi:MAG: PAC2 family protein [Ilumatobacteraceae bacterium]